MQEPRKTMSLDEFADTALRMGYCTKQQAKDYAKRTKRMEFTDEDLMEVYRSSSPWDGCGEDGLLGRYGWLPNGKMTVFCRNHDDPMD